MQVHVVTHVHVPNIYPFKSKFVWNVLIKVILRVIKVIGFSVLNICELTTARNCDSLKCTLSLTKWIDNSYWWWHRNSHHRHPFTIYPNVKCRMDWFYRKPYISLLFIFQVVKKELNMFLILVNSERDMSNHVTR